MGSLQQLSFRYPTITQLLSVEIHYLESSLKAHPSLLGERSEYPQVYIIDDMSQTRIDCIYAVVEEIQLVSETHNKTSAFFTR